MGRIEQGADREGIPMRSANSQFASKETPGLPSRKLGTPLARRATVWIALVALGFTATPCIGADITADLTVIQRLIVHEILRLGGDWEPHLIGFEGPRFTDRHYEMLEHMTGIHTLALQKVHVPPSAFSSIAKMSTVHIVEIQDCSCSAEGIEALRRLPKLRWVYLEEVKLTKKGMESLSQLDKLEELDLDDVDMPPKSLNLLAKMRGLKKLFVFARPDPDKHEIEQLKASLPNCDVEVSTRGQ